MIYSAKEIIQAKIAEDVLKQNGVESHIGSKPDSVMPFFGEAELYVPAEKAELAMRILKDNDIKDEEE